MIDHEYLGKLLPILKANGVKSVEMQGLKLEFYVEQSDAKVVQTSPKVEQDSIDNIAAAIRKQEESLPADLRADNLMNFDNIMNWSSPDRQEDEPEMPLTGEAPL